MPPRKRYRVLNRPPWVEQIDDQCLRDVVTEALIAADYAREHGAGKDRVCKRILASGDAIIDQLASGKVPRERRCLTASAALRKYTTADQCILPSKRRGRHRG